jgi:hypothetical protein
MVSFTAIIERFATKGEKTGWTYILIPVDVAEQINPAIRIGYRVKGRMDSHEVKGAFLPMGGGDFIMPLNAETRKVICKSVGAELQVSLEVDTTPYELNPEMMDCLAYDPDALGFFQSLTKSHQNYFSKWVESAKTEVTKEKRISLMVFACGKKMGYPEMMRWQKENKDKLLG